MIALDPPVSASVPDWSREQSRWAWAPGARLLHALRRYQYWKVRRLPILAALLRRRWVVSARFWAAVSGADIPLNTAIGGGLALPHPNGIVIHPDVTLGVNCLIFQQVTLGQGGKKPGVPTVGGHVDIGAGAKILGGVTIGDHARIGANAVVLDDVPAGATAVGVPARILGVPATLPEGIPDARA